MRTLSSEAPVAASKTRNVSMSATYSRSPAIAIPFGACSVIPEAAPSIHLSARTSPVGETREMNPLPSLSPGLPLMFDTR